MDMDMRAVPGAAAMGRPVEEPHHVTARPASYKYTTSPQNQERGPFTRTLTIRLHFLH